ncbi:hypothetical protein ROL70_20485 [Cronobacter sakazakii]|uniref:hypothetical protein n=1 Tax=Cronobacter sakazakii TaxID=28141 RepID=UPI0009775889|nr:hypothetical protein [Cronobacter sakazakii]MDT3587355.1 hypothetical protein [Cronobacter sakazakii]UXD97714.1 hypothetical protein K1721_21200 [Cronobacter sakazakii]
MKVAACYERSELFMKVTTLLEVELTPSQKPNRSDRQEIYNSGYIHNDIALDEVWPVIPSKPCFVHIAQNLAI